MYDCIPNHYNNIIGSNTSERQTQKIWLSKSGENTLRRYLQVYAGISSSVTHKKPMKKPTATFQIPRKVTIRSRPHYQ